MQYNLLMVLKEKEHCLFGDNVFLSSDSYKNTTVLAERPVTHFVDKKDKSDNDVLATSNLCYFCNPWNPALSMLYLFFIHALFMLYPCLIHVLSMLCPCLIHAWSMLYSCFIHVLFMLYSCFIHALSMLYPCFIHVLSMLIHALSMLASYIVLL